MPSIILNAVCWSLPVIALCRRGIFNKVLGMATIGLLLGSSQAYAEGLAVRDQLFINNAMETSHAGIQASQLALMKSTDPDVTMFAMRMRDEYTRMEKQLRQLMALKDVPAPARAGVAQRIRLSLLEKLHGPMFDRQFLRVIGITAHQEALTLFSKAMVGSSDHEIKVFASKAMPDLQYHLNLATAIKARLDARN